MKKLALFLFLSFFLFACAGERVPSFRLNNIGYFNFDPKEVQRISFSLYRAIDTLRGCEYFHEKYSLQAIMLDTMFNDNTGDGVIIKRVNLEEISRVESEWQKIYDKKFGKGSYTFRIIAFADIEKGTVNIGEAWLNANSYNDPFDINLTRVIGHEILHLVGMPDHKITLFEDTTDDIEKTLSVCGLEKYRFPVADTN